MEDQVNRWLRLMGGPDWEGLEGRDRAIREMRALGTARVFPLLQGKLSDTDIERRCAAIQALGLVDVGLAVELLVPLLSDPDEVVRLCVCEALSAPDAVAAVETLLAVLEKDPDPQVRNYAAGALGQIGCPTAIPGLLRAMDTDHEPDIHCHTPSHCAAMALDDLLGTNHTRIRVSESTCKMRPGPPDLSGLRQCAIKRFEEWRSGRA